mgnify:FL=1|jgi:hypothetical protein|tara:strand:- start:1210 stop:1602 length:393 start_codon:yes stop_codon:yes gene_type:complete
MKLEEIQQIVEEVYPKIEKHYGYSKFLTETTPYIEYETSIYGRLSGEEDDGTFGEQTPHAEFDRIDNSIVIYYPKMEDREHIVQTLVHEYQHYLQSPSWMKRYYDMGYDYHNHPYEVAAYNEEINYKLFI